MNSGVITSILGVLGFELHSSGTEPVTFFGTQSSLGEEQFSFGGAQAVMFGGGVTAPKYPLVAPAWLSLHLWRLVFVFPVFSRVRFRATDSFLIRFDLGGSNLVGSWRTWLCCLLSVSYFCQNFSLKESARVEGMSSSVAKSLRNFSLFLTCRQPNKWCLKLFCWLYLSIFDVVSSVICGGEKLAKELVLECLLLFDTLCSVLDLLCFYNTILSIQ